MVPTYENEDKIIWLKDREALGKIAWVRERILVCSIRTGPVKAPRGEMLIGYAVLKRESTRDDERGFLRRIFTMPFQEEPLLDLGISRADSRQNSMPADAVDPLSVQPGKPGRRLGVEERRKRNIGLHTLE